MADTMKDGLGTICIFPGFDYAAAHAWWSHVIRILLNACLTVFKTLLRWYPLEVPEAQSHNAFYACNSHKLIEFATSCIYRLVKLLARDFYYSAFSNPIGVRGSLNSHQEKCTYSPQTTARAITNWLPEVGWVQDYVKSGRLQLLQLKYYSNKWGNRMPGWYTKSLKLCYASLIAR